MFSFFSRKEKKDDYDFKNENELTDDTDTELKVSYTDDLKNLKNLKNEVERLTNEVENLKNRPDSILYYDGTLYVGSVKKDENGFDRPHGFGTICHSNGVRYTGEWKDGLYDGHGTLYSDYYSPPFTCQWVKHVAQVNETYKK